MPKAPAIGRGFRFELLVVLHLGITLFSLSVPNSTRLSARRLCLCGGQILRESGSGERYGESESDNCCN